MARYGCLVIGVVIALAILFVVVFFWSGWLNRPVGHSIAPSAQVAFAYSGRRRAALRQAQGERAKLSAHRSTDRRLHPRKRGRAGTPQVNPNPPMDGARIGEGGEEVTDATVRARIRVDWRLAGGLSALLGVLIAACDGCGERDGGIGHGKKHSRTGPGASWRGS